MRLTTLLSADLNVVLGRILIVEHDVTNIDHGTGGPHYLGILDTP